MNAAVTRGAGLLTCLLAACASAPAAPAAAPPQPMPVATDAGAEQSSGMTLEIGLVTMSGGTELSCRMRQDSDDRMRLVLTIRPECATVGRLHVVVRSDRFVVETRIPRTLEEKVRVDVDDGPSFALPPEGTLLRAKVSATCSGSEARETWATAHCTVRATEP